MSKPSDLPPLDDELSALLRAEANTQDGPAPQQIHAMRTRLEAALPIAFPKWEAPDAAPLTDGLSGTTAAVQGVALGKGVLGASLLANLVVGGALVGAGMVAGAGMHAAFIETPETRVVTKTVEVRVPVYLPAKTGQAIEPGAMSEALPDAGPAKRMKVTREEPAQDERDRQLEKENALITRAQSALARREAKLAIGALEAHAARFDRGQLSEEREALWIQALVMAGDLAQARGRSERFKKRYPRSMLMPAIDAALGDTP